MNENVDRINRPKQINGRVPDGFYECYKSAIRNLGHKSEDVILVALMHLGGFTDPRSEAVAAGFRVAFQQATKGQRPFKPAPQMA